MGEGVASAVSSGSWEMFGDLEMVLNGFVKQMYSLS